VSTWTAVATLGIAAAACSSSDPSSQPQGDELIAFASNRDGDEEIFVMRPDGSDVRQVTRNTNEKNGTIAFDGYPAWSPGGRRIAFVSTRDYRGDFISSYELYVVDADGSDARRLTENRIAEFDPRWIGDRLAFRSCWREMEPRSCRLETLNADGSGRGIVFPAPPEAVMLLGAAVSPNGSRVAYSKPQRASSWAWRDMEGWVWARINPEIHVVGTDGSGERRLTRHPGNDESPVWSPDGTKIAFESDRDHNGDCVFWECHGFAKELYVMNADGSGKRRLTRTRASEHDAAWSPDGTRIVFARTRDDERDDFELYVVNADGTCERQLTDNTAEDHAPAWTGAGEGPLEC
jgi:Tol biopolymer transport system component